MDSDIQTPITIEVTVPRIVLPSLNEQPQTEPAGQGESEQLRLLLGNTRHRLLQPSGQQDFQITMKEAPTYTTRAGLFHLFRLQAGLTPKRSYLLQILRQWQGRKHASHVVKEGREQHCITDELSFTLEYRDMTHSDTSSQSQTVLTPGRNHVVIVLNEEGIPGAYSIDGAEG